MSQQTLSQGFYWVWWRGGWRVGKYTPAFWEIEGESIEPVEPLSIGPSVPAPPDVKGSSESWHTVIKLGDRPVQSPIRAYWPSAESDAHRALGKPFCQYCIRPMGTLHSSDCHYALSPNQVVVLRECSPEPATAQTSEHGEAMRATDKESEISHGSD